MRGVESGDIARESSQVWWFAAIRTGSSTSRTTAVPGRYAGMTPSRTTRSVPLLLGRSLAARSGRRPAHGSPSVGKAGDGIRAAEKVDTHDEWEEPSRGGGSGFSSTLCFGRRIPRQREPGHTSIDARERSGGDLTAVRPIDGQ